jgi:calpain
MGSWSPDATNWANVSEATRRELDGEAFHDGGFWIGFQDFLKYFDTIDFCHINTDVDREVVFNGRWEVALNAGGVQKGDWTNYARNPQCFIKLRSPNREDPEGLCSAVISLMQRRQPSSKVKGVNKVGFRVYQVDKDAEELTSQFFSYRRNDGRHRPVAKTPTWQDGRETGIRVRLPVGKYCIIPSTYDVDKEGDFILRVHIEQHGEEEEESDTDTLVDLDSRVGTPYVGSTMGRGTLSSGTQLYGRTGRGRTTPLYGSRLQLEHVSDNGSERSHR